MKQLDNRSIETNGEIIKFDIAIRQIVEYKDFFVVLIRERTVSYTHLTLPTT